MRIGDTYRNAIGYDQKLYQRIQAEAAVQVGKEIFSVLWAEGRSMTTEQVMAARGLERVLPVASLAPSASTIAVSSVPPGGLTRREFEVLRLLAEGLTNAQIAKKLVISPTTVNSYLSSLYNVSSG